MGNISANYGHGKVKKSSYGSNLTNAELRTLNGLARSKKDKQKARISLQDSFEAVGGLDASLLYEQVEEGKLEGVTLDDVLALRVQEHYINNPGEANILALSKVRGEQMKREAEITVNFKPHEYFGGMTKEDGALNVIEMTEADVVEVESGEKVAEEVPA